VTQCFALLDSFITPGQAGSNGGSTSPFSFIEPLNLVTQSVRVKKISRAQRLSLAIGPQESRATLFGCLCPSVVPLMLLILFPVSHFSI
jgi:hypothetical protein